MKKFISSSGFYELAFPEDWTYSENDNLISFYNETSGVGALQISSYLLDEKYHVDLKMELAEMVSDKTHEDASNLIPLISSKDSKANIAISQNNRFWEYHMIHQKNKILFITYNCQDSDKNLERKIINQILESIKIS